MRKIASIAAILILTIVLFACQKDSYIISYNLDGGIGLINDEIVEKGKLATKPNITPTKEGFEFKYWEYLDREFDFKTPIIENIVLKAKWGQEDTKPNINYLVTFDSNGGTNVEAVEVHHGDLVAKPENPTKDNMVFIGWYLDGVAFDFQSKILGSITLKAVWEEAVIPVNKFTITFDSAGGSFVPDQVIDKGNKVEEPIDPTKDDYIFNGWYLGDTLYDFNLVVNKDLDLVARWISINDLKVVTIEQNNGEEDLILNVLPNSKITEKLNLVYEGYGFVGLYRDFEFEDEFKIDEDIIEDNITLYVRWAEILFEETNLERESGINMIQEDNNAYLLGLDNNYFDVRTSGSSTRTGIYNNTIRIYRNGLLEFTINESFIIKKLEVKFSSEYNSKPVVMKIGNEAITVSDYFGKTVTYDNLHTNYFSFKANNTETSTDRLYIDKIIISFIQVGEDVQREDDINRPEFDFGEGSLIISDVGDLITYPVVKANDTEDGEITAEVDNVETNININVIGVYYIHYFAEDEDGNIGYGYITVIIREAETLRNYYGDITSEGEILQEELSTLLNETGSFVSYAKAKDVLEISDRDPKNFNNVWLIYNSASIKGKWQHPNYAREHVWAKSQLGDKHSITGESDGFGKSFGESYIGAASDLQNLRAINPSVNSTHSNYKFGIDSSTGEWGLVPNQPVTTFFPGDEHKGDVARILLYMMLMWDITPREDISMLVNWHLADPVDNFEIIRNEVISSYQGNRNPFIDYPTLVERAFVN